MQVVCEATQCPDTRVSLLNLGVESVQNSGVYGMSNPCVCVFQVRVAALQNLVKIMSLYYQYMETYMGPALFAVSIHSGLCPKPRGSDTICICTSVHTHLDTEFINWRN